MRWNTRAMLAGVAVFALSAALPAVAQMSMVEDASIADGASLAAAPKDVSVSFIHSVFVKSVTLTDAQGKAVPLAYVAPSALQTGFTAPLPALTKGGYVVRWVVAGADGHEMRGAIRFAIGGAALPAKTVEVDAHDHHAGHMMMAKTSIADGASVAAGAQTMAIDFGHAMRLTRVQLVTATGERIPLSFTPAAQPASSASIPLGSLEPDSYSFTWVAAATDHEMSGTVKFTVK